MSGLNATDRWRAIQNIIARVGIDGDIIGELAKVESMINAIDQGKMMPPPLPPEITDQNNATTMPTEALGGTQSPESSPTMGKYDNL